MASWYYVTRKRNAIAIMFTTIIPIVATITATTATTVWQSIQVLLYIKRLVENGKKSSQIATRIIRMMSVVVVAVVVVAAAAVAFPTGI